MRGHYKDDLMFLANGLNPDATKDVDFGNNSFAIAFDRSGMIESDRSMSPQKRRVVAIPDVTNHGRNSDSQDQEEPRQEEKQLKKQAFEKIKFGGMEAFSSPIASASPMNLQSSNLVIPSVKSIRKRPPEQPKKLRKAPSKSKSKKKKSKAKNGPPDDVNVQILLDLMIKVFKGHFLNEEDVNHLPLVSKQIFVSILKRKFNLNLKYAQPG